MEPFKIVKDNKPSLRKKSVDVALPMNQEDEDTILKMFKYLTLSQDEEYRKKYPNVKEGVGLAAPQIGINKNMLVVHFFYQEKEISHALVNPKIISTSAKKCYLSRGEGCLSVAKQHEGYVMRHYKIKVKAYDALKKKNVEIVAIGMEAIVLQHEIDHLFGILYYDHINPMNPMYIPEDAIEI